jgi:drug/metabolite transporter (DMT)-like permease
MTTSPQPRAARERLRATADGTIADAFSAREWALVATIAAIWGSSFLWIDIALEALQPGVIVMARVALGAAALALIPRARRTVDAADLPRVVLLGLVWIAVPLSLFPIAQQWVDSSVAGLINGAMPLATAAWATVLLRRAPGGVQLAGLGLGFAGVVAISWPQVTGSQATAFGTGLIVAAVALYGLAANLAVPLQQRYGALPVLLRAQLAALVVVVPYGLLSLPGSSFAAGPVLAMVPLGTLGTGLAFVFMATLVGRVGGPRGSLAIYFVPVVAIVLGVAVRGEAVAPVALVGTGLVVVGAWLTSRRERRARPEDEAVPCA